ncbi:restriction endonuclease subunit S [Castellaniella sp.]|uniref:restriction endonuclease subunit S n=1 Tax=Castellaniella sp. TaxID=1955812 RepID=UPI002AFF371F|nr:restriction endonuclease subunit S [Castellaniella sp.]
MSEFQTRRLDSFIAEGSVLLGRGDIISKEDIDAYPGPYPIYSSSAQGYGKFGEYGKFMFDEELVTWSVDGGGYFFYRDKHRYSVTNVCGYMRVKSSKLHPKFVFYSLANQHRYLTFDYTTKAHPSVIQKLYWLPTIGYERQRKIATILTGIDTVIEKTEALIAKYQQIKAGLMHDLFTRGVLPNGQLRPLREQAPDLYQETAIGWIPREWSVSTLEGLLASLPNNIRSGPFGSALLKHELVEDGIPFLGIDNIHTEHFEAEFRRFVSERKFVELAKYKVRPRDVVITIMGTVGRCCVIPDNLELALSSKHLWTMTFDPEKVIPELVCWQLNHASWAQAWFRRAMQGGIMDAIQSSTLKALLLPVPSIDEQSLIYEYYLKITTRIRQDSGQLTKLQKQKLGLMHDLLTGKVPVTIENKTTTTEAVA